ncbi:MAG: Trigger factor [Chlamydiales bacterium]|nr:Trigger factor [Chlamydiales bacterium]
MDLAVQTFENDAYSVEATEDAGCLLTLKIFVKPPAAQKSYKKAVKIVNKQISIPGFRKGRAPDHTVISRYSSYVDQEWKEDIVNEAYKAAVDLVKIYPISQESFKKPKIESCSQEEGAIISLAYEHYPKAPEVDLQSLTIPLIETESISEERIEETLQEIKRSHADWEKIEDRAVQEGDYVDVSISAIDKEPPIEIVKDRRFEMADKKIAPWLKKLLLGLAVDESAEGMSELSEDATEEVKKGFETRKMQVTVHAIHKILLPELDEELAKKLGADSVEDLCAKVRANLEKEMEEAAQEKRIEALEDALLTAYNFDLPASLLEEERASRIEYRIQKLKEQGLSDEEIKAKESEIELEVAKDTEESYRLYFLNKQIEKLGGVSVSQDEISGEVMRQIQLNPYLFQQENDPDHTKNLITRISHSLLKKKVNEYALTQVKVAKIA